jgi:hypothetical protein
MSNRCPDREKGAGFGPHLGNGIMHVLIDEDIYDKVYVNSCCMGFEDLKKGVGVSS